MLWQEWFHMQSVGGKEWVQTFISLVSAVGTRGKCPAFCCQDFFVAFLSCRSTLMSVLNSTIQSFPCQSNNMQQARKCRCLNHMFRVRKCWVCFVLNLVAVHLAVWLQGETLQTETCRTCIRIGLWWTVIERWRHFSSEWQGHWWHRWCSWHKLHTVNWQYKLSTYCTCSPQVYRGVPLG